jgi:RNA-directed DNA polymerase
MADLNGHEGGNAGNGQGVPKGPDRRHRSSAEGMEGRGRAEGNAGLQNTPRAQDRERGVPSAWDRIRQAAKTDEERRFTTLLHHVYRIETLREAYFSLKRDAAPGVDDETWRTDGEHLEGKLNDLSGRLRRGRTGRSRSGGCSYRSRTDGSDPSGSPRSRTRWSSVPS